jgi:hypothetical protein
MNTISNYKQKIQTMKKGESKNNAITIVENNNDLPMHIKLDTPIIDPKSDCFKYEYNLNNAINTNLKDIGKNYKTISFCIYRINNCKIQENVKFPFLQYLVYKYPESSDKTSNLMVFPFIKIKQSVKADSKKFIKKLVNKDVKIKGFIENKNTIFLFYDFTSIDAQVIDKVYQLQKRNTLWWCLIDEICNHKQVIKFPVHKSVVELFYKNPVLIYLKKDNKRLEIPIVAFYGNYFNFLPVIATLGQKTNIVNNKNNNLFFSSFDRAIRFGAWTENYSEKSVYGDKISDYFGKYNKGGLIRFALFLGNIDLLIDNSMSEVSETLSKNDWKKNNQSLYINDIDFDGVHLKTKPEYVVKHFTQQTPLSYHEIDENTLTPVWESDYEAYNIV